MRESVVEVTGDSLITAAAVFAAEAHASQVRKELNEPYIVHPLRVGQLAALLGMSPEFIAACYLHDVVEDTPIPYETIESLFPEYTAKLVQAMTKWWGVSQPSSVVVANKATYYQGLKDVRGGVLLKVLDRTDNLKDFAKVASRSPSAHRWARKYFDKTEAEVSPLLHHLDAEMDKPTALGARALYESALLGLKVTLS